MGCVTTLKHGPFIVKSPELSIPNIFSPNGDGINDQFVITYSGSQAFAIDVTDRWGVRVFKSTSKIQSWDGKAGNAADAAEGVYFYNLRIGDKSYVGNVTLVR